MRDHRRLVSILLRAGAVAVVIGTVLNLINQGEALFGGGEVNGIKLALTYAVPFFVSAHGALTAPKR